MGGRGTEPPTIFKRTLAQKDRSDRRENLIFRRTAHWLRCDAHPLWVRNDLRVASVYGIGLNGV